MEENVCSHDEEYISLFSEERTDSRTDHIRVCCQCGAVHKVTK